LQLFFFTLLVHAITVPPGGNTMTIITGKQAQKGAKTILKETGWTISRAARALGWPRETLAKIIDGRTKNPSQQRMDQIAEMLAKVVGTEDEEQCETCNGSGVIPSVSQCPECVICASV
jgi:predicted transcriptional regulator